MRIRLDSTTRRGFLASLSAIPLVTTVAAAAEPPGLITRPQTIALLDGLSRVDDGDPGAPRVRVLISPGCERSLQMWEASREFRMRASWRWIPYGGDDASRRVCAAALEVGTPAAMESCLRGDLRPAATPGVMVEQDRVIDRDAGRMLWEATATALGTPTSVYVRRSGIAYAVRGALNAGHLAAMLEVAA